MTEDAPTTDDMRDAYIEWATGGIYWRTPADQEEAQERAGADFDLWLVGVKRDAWNEAAAIDAGCHDCIAQGGHKNPYRKEANSD